MIRSALLLLAVCELVAVAAAATSAPPTTKTTAPHRPVLVTDALKCNQDLHYFGLGSNMLKSKLENCSVCGNKITCKSIEPAYVPNARLAFNMRGFLPLEPGMGSVEIINGDGSDENSNKQDKPTKPLHA